MNRPDFAHTDLGALPEGDLRFLVENMPRAGTSYEEIAQVIGELPTTLESMLTSDYVFELIRNRERLLLDVSPFLLFSILLRRSLGRPRSPLERRVINYLANLLALFIHTDRLYRVEPGDAEPHTYVVELMQEMLEADPRREFVTCAHIGNYALWLTGLQFGWLEHRHRFGRRPVSPEYYAETGRAHFDRAARHHMARDFDLQDVFLRLAMMFDHYRKGLNHMRSHFMSAA